MDLANEEMKVISYTKIGLRVFKERLEAGDALGERKMVLELVELKPSSTANVLAQM